MSTGAPPPGQPNPNAGYLQALNAAQHGQGTMGAGSTVAGTTSAGSPIGNNTPTSPAPAPTTGTPSTYQDAAQQAAAASQAAVNAQTQANRPDQTTPFGSSTWYQDPSGQWHQNVSLSPQMQGVYNTLLGQYQQGPGAFQAAAYNQAKSRLDPEFQQGQEQLETKLANEGAAPGSAAYTNDMGVFNRAKNDAYQQAYDKSFNQGLLSQQANFGQLQGLGGMAGMPGFQAAGQSIPAQILQAMELQNQYNLQQGQQSADMWSGIGSFAGTAGMMALMAMSDERVKSNIKRLPVEAAPGIPFATYKYKHAPEQGHHLGVIAQDVEKVRPDAVAHDEAGIKHVDYSKLTPFGTR